MTSPNLACPNITPQTPEAEDLQPLIRLGRLVYQPSHRWPLLGSSHQAIRSRRYFSTASREPEEPETPSESVYRRLCSGTPRPLPHVFQRSEPDVVHLRSVAFGVGGMGVTAPTACGVRPESDDYWRTTDRPLSCESCRLAAEGSQGWAGEAPNSGTPEEAASLTFLSGRRPASC